MDLYSYVFGFHSIFDASWWRVVRRKLEVFQVSLCFIETSTVNRTSILCLTWRGPTNWLPSQVTSDGEERSEKGDFKKNEG